MRRTVPRRSILAAPHPALDRRQKFALFGSIIGLVLVGFALPQLISFIGVRGDVLSGPFPPGSAEPSSDLNDRRGYGGFQTDASASPSPTPTPSPSSTSQPGPTPSGTLSGNPPQGGPVDPTSAPVPPVGANPTPPPRTPPPAATGTPPPTAAPTTAPTTPPPTVTPPSPSPSPAPTEPPAPTPTPTLPDLPPDAPTITECADGIDNDRDLFTDTGVLGVPLLLGDPQCSSGSDPSESS